MKLNKHHDLALRQILLLAIWIALRGDLAAASIDPMARNFTKEGGGAAVLVTAGAAEVWPATSDVSWIHTLTPTPTNRTGSGQLFYLVNANLSADTRVGRITIAGVNHVVTQTGYPSTVNPATGSFNNSGGIGQITVTVGAGISWTAVSDQQWVRITAGASGFGSGSVAYEVGEYTDVATRYANISVAGQTFVVTQTGRDVVLTPANALAPPETSVIPVLVKALASTSWTVVSDVNWLFPIGTSAGSGDATIQVGVAENASWAQRFGSLRVGTALLTVGQAGKANPVYSINPPLATAPAPGASGVVAVSATLDAPWAATSSVPWLTIVAGALGAGNGAIQYVVSQNPYVTNRTGRIEFAGAPPQPAPDLMRAQLYHFHFAGTMWGRVNNVSIDGRDDGADKRLYAGQGPTNSVDGSLYFDNTYTRFNDLWPSRRSRAEVTCAFWFNADWANRVNRLLSLEGDTAGDGVKIYAEADGRLRVDGPRGSLQPNFYIEGGRWYHLMLRQSAGSVDLWVNGRQVASQPWGNQVRQTLYRSRIGGGGARWGTGNFYQGYIDELRLWDRDLSDHELLSLYQTESTGVSARIYNAQPTNPAQRRPDGRVAFYRMEGNNLDADQFGRQWTVYSDNMPRFTTDRFGVAGAAFRAERSGYLRAEREVLFHTNQAASHLFWVKFNDLSQQNIFIKEWRDPNLREGGYATSDWVFLGVKDANNLQLIWRRDRIGLGAYDRATYNIEKALDINKWYQVVITGNDSTGTVTVYIDGLPVTTVGMLGFQWGISGARDDNHSSAYLGSDAGYGWGRASGSFDDYQIYDRVLTAQEVYQLYQAERPKTYSHEVTQAGAVGVLSSNEVSFAAGGGAGSVGLSIGSAAVWTVASDSAWVTVNGSTNGAGSGTINFTVGGNSTINAREARLLIAGVPLRILQAGRAVTLTGGGPFTFGPDGGSANFSISSENNSAWQVVNTNAWINVVSGATGTAPGQAIFVVSPYGSPLVARTGFLTVGDKVVTVNQSGYTATVSPLVAALPANGGSRTVTVSVPPGAIWSALAQVPWITVIGGQSQSGSGSLSYVVNGNAGGVRSGQIILAGQVITINQAAVTADALVDLQAANASVRTGREVVVPITATGFTNIQSAQFSVKWDYGALEYVGVESFGLPGMGGSSFGTPAAGTLTMAWEHPTLDSVTLSPTQPLFAVRFRALGTPGSSSVVRIESIPTVVEIVDVNSLYKVARPQSGTVTIISAHEISGRIRYGETTVAVTNANLSVSGGAVLSAATGQQNSYLFEVEDAVNVNVSATKTGDSAPSRGVSTADVVLLRRHILAMAPLDSPYRLIAADANASGSVTTADIVQIRKLILGQITELPAGMWRLLPKDYLFPEPSLPYNAPNVKQFYSVRGDYTAQDFIALKLGDLNDSWTNDTSGGLLPQSLGSVDQPGRPLLRVGQGVARPDGTGTVSVWLEQQGEGLMGLQFSLRWDSQLFEFGGLSQIGLPGFSAEHFSVQPGQLAVAWDNAGGTTVAAVGGRVFDLVLRARGNSGVSSVRLAEEPTPRELVTLSGAQQPTARDGAMLASTVDPVVQVGAPLGNERVLEFATDEHFTYALQSSTNLAEWRGVDGVQYSAPSPGVLRCRLPDSWTANQQIFFRVVISSPQAAGSSVR